MADMQVKLMCPYDPSVLNARCNILKPRATKVSQHTALNVWLFGTRVVK